MAIGRISALAFKAAQKAAKASKAAKAAKSKSLGTISRGGSRSGVESAGNIPRLQRSIRNARTTRNALTDAAAMAGVAGIVGGAIYGGGKTKKATPAVPSAKKKPSTPSRHTSKITKPPAGLKKATRPTAKKAPAKKPVKKAARPMASVPTVKSRTGGKTKTKVEVGSSIIRDRKGAIKKVTGPSNKTRAIVDSRKNAKSKYARMTRAQIMRLGGVEKRNYKKWKASQGK